MLGLRTGVIPFALALALAACAAGEGGEAEQAEEAPDSGLELTPRVVLETTKGTVVLELDRQHATETVTNFLNHVAAGFYDGLQFHRVVTGSVIQTGVLSGEMKRRSSNVIPVANEADNGLKNLRGTVAMARSTAPHSATSQFFINLRDNPGFDHQDKTERGWGYAVFGKVIEGLDVVDSIGAVRTRKYGQHENLPVDPIVITKAYIQQ